MCVFACICIYLYMHTYIHSYILSNYIDTHTLILCLYLSMFNMGLVISSGNTPVLIKRIVLQYIAFVWKIVY